MSTAPLAAPAGVRAPGVAVLRPFRLLATFCAWLVFGTAVGLAAGIVGAGVVGYKSMTVISGSMEPTLGLGSVVLDEEIAPLDARPGDIVTFQDPSRRGQLITHRLVSARAEGETAFMITKGDANGAAERWSVPVRGKIGRVVTHVPKVGYLRQFLSGPLARFALLGIVLALGCCVVYDVWRRP